MLIRVDIHHGDGVELAFYQSNRVMTVSFHKYTGDFFPGTGKLDDNGHGLGKHFCLNVPLLDGIDDNMYLTIFKTVVEDTVSAYQPSSIVLQCGADSLGCDRLGAFNLSIAAHGECVNFVRKYNVPLLVLGGGGYTIKNVSRCWTHETAVLVGADIPNELPKTVFDAYFADSHFKLHPPLTGRVDNQNTPASLQRITVSIRNKLRYLQGAPSVAMQEIPPDLQGLLEDEDRNQEEKDEEMNGTKNAGETRPEPTTNVLVNEFYDGEHDVDADTSTPTPPGASVPRGASSGRRARGGRRGRGRGRPRTAAHDGADDDTTDIDTPPPPKRARGGRRGRGGRGRGRGASAKGKEREIESDTEDAEPGVLSPPSDVDMT